MFRVTRRYGFAASHRLHSVQLSDEENRRLYGKCNNPYGHGHNYVVEVSVRGPLDEATGRAVDTAALDGLVEPRGAGALRPSQSERRMSSRFANVVPTSENLAVEICRQLKRNWKDVFPGEWPRLEKIRIAETPRNIFEVRSR